VASRELDTLDAASLDRFRAELVEAGFRGSEGGLVWTGPIAEPLRAFTTADEMTIKIVEGWPFVQPALYVDGMRPLEHANAEGQVCLWDRGDGSRQWTTWHGWKQRIQEWADRQANGFRRRDATMDAHRYFEQQSDKIAELDLSTLTVGEGYAPSGLLRGAWRNQDARLELRTEGGGRQDIKGRWFYRDSIPAPPRNVGEFQALLTDDQRPLFSDLLKGVTRSSKKAVAVLVWQRLEAANGLVLLLDRAPTKGSARNRHGTAPQVRARALELSPVDPLVLRARAGPDAAWLEHHSVVIFGAGSVGSHVALLLAECGLGAITLVDRERLRAGNVVRHVAPHSAVSDHKVHAVQAVIAEHAPWTEVNPLVEEPWAPQRLTQLLGEHDLAVDATGLAGFTDQLSLLANASEETIVSTALYRDGALARVRRQAPGDEAIIERHGSERYPHIPPGPDTEHLLEPGCSAPVTQASPRAVTACAGLAVDVVIDTLAHTHALASDIIDVYRPLDEPPFNNAGRLSHG
jgi:ThiF family